ncbi:hypothetical protein L248_0981 [Schleiferilactobacillus shenzhenensis LY-73]|uniref:Uncharacterized protein n=1 Tax=Schleiferilactobacillus shenzhenensis LY-73 TaxID=1231336 RepID=U4TJQ2_9LACO|nr:hypothetical protein L248_0981 [Schleiferilactobacillus shenzhenensis LY-73]
MTKYSPRIFLKLLIRLATQIAPASRRAQIAGPPELPYRSGTA